MTIRLTIAGAVLFLLLATIGAVLLNRRPSGDAPPDETPSAVVELVEEETVDLTGFEPPDPPVRAQEHFVGSEACAECHAGLSAAFHGHAMAHSLASALAAPVVENSPTTEFIPDRVRTYRVERTDAGVWHHEILKDSQGQTLYDLSVPIAFEVGSGRRGRSYLVNREGLLFMSPITWYASQSRWDLSPGYEPGNHAGFQRRVSDGCLACHAGRVADDPDYTDRYDPQRPFLEESIGCERCHGPGGDHVEHRRAAAEAGGEPVAGDIVNPARLEPSARDAVCNQCHLQGARRILQFGRSEFDFRPGMRLSDVWTVYLKSTGEDEGRAPGAVSQYELMRQSACFQKSEGRLSCTSCHDPHRLPAAQDRSAFYREKCLNCHGQGAVECREPLSRRQARVPDDSCVACHFPTFSAADVPHTALSDHRIPRRPRPTPAAPSVDPAAPPRLPELLVESGAEISPFERQRSRGILMAEFAARFQQAGPGDVDLANRALRLLESVLATGHRDADVLLAVGVCHMVRQDLAQARTAWEQTLQVDPENEEALEKLAIVFQTMKDARSALKYYERLVEVNPYRAEYWGRLAYVRGLLGQPPKAIEAARRALELNPGLIQAHQWLAGVYEGLEKSEQSERHRLQYEKLVEALFPKPLDDQDSP